MYRELGSADCADLAFESLEEFLQDAPEALAVQS